VTTGNTVPTPRRPANHLESLHETIYWLSQPGIRDQLAEADQAIASGDIIDSAELRRRLGLPRP